MRVGAIQSSFIPWRGYFDLINSVDVFIFHDDIQYTKGDWRNRNKIKTTKGAEWITVPVIYKVVSQLICNTEISYTNQWSAKHSRILNEYYAKSPYYDIMKQIFSGQCSKKMQTISQLNITLIKKICDYLEIKTPMRLSTELELNGKKTNRLIDMLKKLNATTYVSGPSADAYLNKETFQKNGIQLEYKSYDYAPYPQLWGEFIGEVTILDLIANCGPDAKNHIYSRTPNKIIVHG